MYQFAMDFAGPIATVIAAAAAIYFAHQQVAVARRQADTAQLQAEIALDKLKYDLFEKRYAIYVKAKDSAKLLERLPDKITTNDLIDFHVGFAEARFFYSQSLCDWLSEFCMKVTDLIAARADRQHTPSVTLLEVAQLYKDMPNHFRLELEFSQLTRRTGPAR